MALRDDNCVYGTYHTHRLRLDRVPMFHLDVLRERALLDILTTVRPNVVFYCSAVRDERACTENALEALTINAEVASDIALCLRPFDGRLIYYSTSKVFSGEKGNYTEEDIPEPTSSYGAAKLRAEALLAETENTFVLRLGTIFGFGVDRRNALLPRLLDQMWEGRQGTFINDEYRTFQSVDDVVEASKRLMHGDSDKSGIYHCPGGSKSTYFDFAKAVARVLGRKPESILSTPGEALQAAYNTPELRGRDTTLKADRFDRNLGPLGMPLEKSLENIKDQLVKGRI